MANDKSSTDEGASPLVSGSADGVDLFEPPADDPKAQADFFLEMLDNFAQAGTPESKRLRIALIQAVSDYAEQAKENKDEAIQVLKAKVLGMEVACSELVLKSISKIRDRFRLEARKLGKKSKAGHVAHTVTEGLTLASQSMEKLLQAAEEGNHSLRGEAQALMERAREVLKVLR